MEVGSPADGAEACNQPQSADNVREGEHLWAEHCTAGLLDCIAEIAGEGVVRIYFQISIIPYRISVVRSF